jgi:hypothetical protein
LATLRAFLDTFLAPARHRFGRLGPKNSILLERRGWSVFAVVEQENTGRLATVRVASPGASGGTVVDLLFASAGIEDEVTAHAQPFELFPGLLVPVATRGDLIAMKVLSRDDRTRPRDIGDLRSLLANANSSDRERAKLMLETIERRGFHRGRRLCEAFAELLDAQANE